MELQTLLLIGLVVIACPLSMILFMRMGMGGMGGMGGHSAHQGEGTEAQGVEERLRALRTSQAHIQRQIEELERELGRKA